MRMFEYIKKKIEPYFPFYTRDRKGMGVRVISPSGEYLVYYINSEGKKDSLKFEYDKDEYPHNLFKHSSIVIEEKEETDEFERQKLIQIRMDDENE